MSAGRLVVDFVANTVGFETDIGRAAKLAEKRAKEIDKNISAMARNVAASFGAAFGVNALARSIGQMIELGDEIGKAAVKSGLAASDFSELAFAAKTVDVQMGVLSSSLVKMQQAISRATSGNAESAETFRALGLSLQEVQALKPDQQFERLGDAISRLRDPADRARAAVTLFGEAGANLLPLFEKGAKGIREAREEASKFGLAFSNEAIAALQKGDDAIKKLEFAWDGFVAKLAVGTVKVAEALDIIDKDRLGELKDQLASVQRDIQAVVMPADGGPFDPKLYEALSKEALILERQIANLQDTYTRGGGPRRGRAPEAAPGFAPPADTTASDTAAKAAQKAGEAQQSALKQIQELTLGLQQQADTFEQSATDVIRYRIATGDLAETFKLAGAAADPFREQLISLTNQLTVMEDASRGAMAAISEFAAENADALNANLEGITRNVTEELEQKTSEMSEFQKQAARNTQDIIADTLINGFDKGAKGVLDSFYQMITKLAAQAVAANIAGKLFGDAGGGKGGGWIGTAMSWIGGLFGGARATGGPVNAGMVYRVNEREPEFFRPRGSGDVIPLSKMPFAPSSRSVTQNIFVEGRVDQRTARQMELESLRGQRVANARLG